MFMKQQNSKMAAMNAMDILFPIAHNRIVDVTMSKYMDR